MPFAVWESVVCVVGRMGCIGRDGDGRGMGMGPVRVGG